MGSQIHSTPTPEPHLAAAYALESKGRFEDALGECQLALTEAPDSAEAHNFHGVILEQLNRQAEAIEAYRAALQLDPDSQEARDNLSEIQAELRSRQQKSRAMNAGQLALIGALTFGVLLGLLGWSAGLASIPRPLADGAYQFNATNSILYALLTTAAISVGALILAVASQNTNRSIRFLIGAALGSLLGRIIAGLTIFAISLVVGPAPSTWWVVWGQGLLTRAIMGAWIGAGLGIALRERALLRFIVAGGVGFASADLLYTVVYDTILFPWLSARFSPFDPNVIVTLTTVFQALVGLLGGAGLGWAVGLSVPASETIEQSLAEAEPATA